MIKLEEEKPYSVKKTTPFIFLSFYFFVFFQLKTSILMLYQTDKTLVELKKNIIDLFISFSNRTY